MFSAGNCNLLYIKRYVFMYFFLVCFPLVIKMLPCGKWFLKIFYVSLCFHSHTLSIVLKKTYWISGFVEGLFLFISVWNIPVASSVTCIKHTDVYYLCYNNLWDVFLLRSFNTCPQSSVLLSYTINLGNLLSCYTLACLCICLHFNNIHKAKVCKGKDITDNLKCYRAMQLYKKERKGEVLCYMDA